MQWSYLRLQYLHKYLVDAFSAYANENIPALILFDIWSSQASRLKKNRKKKTPTPSLSAPNYQNLSTMLLPAVSLKSKIIDSRQR